MAVVLRVPPVRAVGFAPWAFKLALRVPQRHIRWKIIMPYAVLVVVLAAVATYLTTDMVRGPLEERFGNQLVAASRTAGDSVVRREEAHLEVARTVAFTRGLPEAVASGSGDDVMRAIEGIAVNSGTERIEVVDAHGERVTGMRLVDAEGLLYTDTEGEDDPGSWPLTERVLADEGGEKFAQIIQVESGIALFTAAPVFLGDDLVGAVVVGTSLETIARQIKAEALADVTIYDFNGNPLTSTFVLDERRANLSSNAPGSGSALDQEERTIWGRAYELLYSDLVVQDAAVGRYSVALQSDFLHDAQETTRLQLGLLFGIGMALVLATGLLLARSITRPVQALVDTAERVTAGDLSARTDVASDDELGRLAECINRMTDRLEGQYMATMRALASAVAGTNSYTVGHSYRVGQLAAQLGRHLGLDERALAQLEIGGYLHDVGVIGVRDSSVMAASALGDDERAFIDTHPHVGVEVPEHERVQAPVRQFVAPVGDGNGGEQHLVARIVAVADLYDALTADRPEGEPMTSEEALEVVRRLVGALHQGAVAALASILPEWERAHGRGSDYQRLAKERARTE